MNVIHRPAPASAITHPYTGLWRAVGIAAGLAALFGPSRGALADDCAAYGIQGASRQAIEDTIRDASTTVDIGLLLGGGVRLETAADGGDPIGVFHLALSAGMTYALGVDVDALCQDPDAPMPAGLGWQVLVASNTFADLEVGALARFHAHLDVAHPAFMAELGGLYRFTDGDDGPGALLSLGYGTQLIHGLVQGQVIFDDPGTVLVIAGVRFDKDLLGLLF